MTHVPNRSGHVTEGTSHAQKIAAAAMGAALLGGGGVGALLMAPTIATAADGSSSTSTQTPSAAAQPDAQRGKWVTDALKKLVDAGTITQSQADAVAKALEAARPAGGIPADRRGPGLAAVATALGISESTSTPRSSPARRSPTWPRPRASTWRRSSARSSPR